MKFHIGQEVVVKDWDEMADEYGSDGLNVIYTKGAYFIDSMKVFCGQHATIEDVVEVEDSDYPYIDVSLAFDILSIDRQAKMYTFTTSMIKECLDVHEEETCDYCCDADSLIGFLNGTI